jgi:hypothetical protein
VLTVGVVVAAEIYSVRAFMPMGRWLDHDRHTKWFNQVGRLLGGPLIVALVLTLTSLGAYGLEVALEPSPGFWTGLHLRPPTLDFGIPLMMSVLLGEAGAVVVEYVEPHWDRWRRRRSGLRPGDPIRWQFGLFAGLWAFLTGAGCAAPWLAGLFPPLLPTPPGGGQWYPTTPSDQYLSALIMIAAAAPAGWYWQRRRTHRAAHWETRAWRRRLRDIQG